MQGSERDIIIVSCVRTLPNREDTVEMPSVPVEGPGGVSAHMPHGVTPSVTQSTRTGSGSAIGFVDDPRRMCVALTRGKFACWIVGNAAALQTSGNWRAFVQHCSDAGCIVPVADSARFDLLSIRTASAS